MEAKFMDWYLDGMFIDRSGIRDPSMSAKDQKELEQATIKDYKTRMSQKDYPLGIMFHGATRIVVLPPGARIECSPNSIIGLCTNITVLKKGHKDLYIIKAAGQNH